MNESTVSGDATAKSSTDRARRFRAKMKKNCSRLDVTIGADVAAKLKAMAKRKDMPMWKVVEDAIEALSE